MTVIATAMLQSVRKGGLAQALIALAQAKYIQRHALLSDDARAMMWLCLLSVVSNAGALRSMH